MVEDRIGLRYGKSLYDLAVERKEVDAAFQDMLLVKQTLQSSRDLQLMLKSPIIPGEKKHQVLNLVFADSLKTQLSRLFIDLIVRKEREQYLSQVADGFLQIYRHARNISEGEVVSATDLPADVLKGIQAKVEQFTGGKFEFTHRIDPSLIGGFSLRVGDRLFDGTVTSALRKMRHELNQKSVVVSE